MDYRIRLAQAQKMLPELSAQALLIEDPTSILYLTGLSLSTGKLIISAQDAGLIVDGRYFETCSKQKLYPVIRLEPDALKSWLFSHSIETLAFDTVTTTYQGYLNIKAIVDVFTINPIKLIPTPSPLTNLRLIKDKEEIQLLRDAARLCYNGYLTVADHLRNGVTEEELALELEIFWKHEGGKKVSFEPIIAFGENGSMPHHRAGNTQLIPNTSVLIDIGVSLQNYNSDMCRVVYFGEPLPEIQLIYPIVAEAKQKALALCQPGTRVGDLDDAARSYITSKGYGEYFNHSLGHGVGLEVHEAPIIRINGPQADMILQEGMVITIEPGIYLPGIGGVRLEDTILITSDGYENLTQLEGAPS